MSSDDDGRTVRDRLERLNLVLDVLLKIAKFLGYGAGGVFFLRRTLSGVTLPNWFPLGATIAVVMIGRTESDTVRSFLQERNGPILFVMLVTGAFVSPRVATAGYPLIAYGVPLVVLSLGGYGFLLELREWQSERRSSAFVVVGPTEPGKSSSWNVLLDSFHRSGGPAEADDEPDDTDENERADESDTGEGRDGPETTKPNPDEAET